MERDVTFRICVRAGLSYPWFGCYMLLQCLFPDLSSVHPYQRKMDMGYAVCQSLILRHCLHIMLLTIKES